MRFTTELRFSSTQYLISCSGLRLCGFIVSIDVFIWNSCHYYTKTPNPVALFNPLPVHSRVLCAEHRGDTHRKALFLLFFYSLRGYLDHKDASKMFGSKDYTSPVYHHLAVRR